MSTVRKPAGSSPVPPAKDPFRYGYRWVQRKDERGRKVWDQQPLTLDDVLHPQMGDVIVGNEDHHLDCTYLFTVLRAWLAGQAGVVVLSDVGIFWDIPNLRNHCPDVMVIRGVNRVGSFTTFDVAQEGARPELIIEITSPNTRRQDLVTKRRQYFQAGVSWYAIADERRVHGQRQLRLLGYRRGRRAYQQLPLDAQGRLHLQAVDLWLGQEQGRAALYEASGRRLGDYTEVDQARQAAEARAQAAEARAQALEAELRRLRGES